VSLSILYVNGAPRSGTTLLMGLLGSFKNVSYVQKYPYEHRFAAYLASTYAVLTSTTPDSSPWQFEAELPNQRLTPFPFQGDDLSKAWYSGSFRDHMKAGLRSSLEALAEGESLKRGYRGDSLWWAEKFPGRHECALVDIFQSFHLLSVTRNPLDITLSRIRLASKKDGIWVHEGGPINIAETVNHEIRKVHDIAMAHQEVSRRQSQPHLLLRYEDAVDDKAWALDQIATTFEFEIDPAMAAKIRARSDEERVYHSTAPMELSSADEKLREDIEAGVSQSGREMLKRLGYDRQAAT
jgi:hypothetical protein